MKNLLILLLLLSIFIPKFSYADDVYVIIQKKQKAKKTSRWTLASWMDTKKRMALMDQWLAFHSSSTVFEFFAGAVYAPYKQQTADLIEKDYKITGGNLGLYWHNLGIETNYNTSDEDYTFWDAALALRLLGRAVQGTNLTVKYGVTNRAFDSETYQNQFFQTDLTFYLFGFFGVDGSYRMIFEGESETLKTKNSGKIVEAGAFIESGFIRLYGKWFNEEIDLKLSSGTVTSTRTGTKFGINFYF